MSADVQAAAERAAFLAAGGWRAELHDALEQLRAAGWSWQAIADECGLSSRQAAEQLHRRTKP